MDAGDGKVLARVVKARRATLGMTQDELGRRSGLGLAYVNNLERGKTRMPDPDDRRRLAGALGVGHGELLVMAGEITKDELVAAATRFSPETDEAGTAADRNPNDPIDDPAGSPRERLALLVRLLTQAEARFVLRFVGILPTEAAVMRERLNSDTYRQWRDREDDVRAMEDLL